jgi:hypothetical protein
MRSNAGRAAIIVAAVVAVVVLFVVLSGGDDNGSSSSQPAATQTAPSGGSTKPAQPKPEVIVVKGGKPVGGVQRLSVSKGDRVRFIVRSDVGDEIHVHGYDFMKDVKAGGSVRFDFPADIDGVFEIELENRGEQIAQLRVNPR